MEKILFAGAILVVCSVVYNYRKLKNIYDNISKLYNIVKDHKNQTNVIFKDKMLEVKYSYFGKDYKIILPLDRKKLIQMIPFKAELILEDDRIVDITQYPGAPYNFSSLELGGKTIIITNLDTRESYKYEGSTYPKYGEELFREE